MSYEHFFKSIKTHVHEELRDYVLTEMKFGNIYQEYPKGFTKSLQDKLNAIIPIESYYYCQSISLYSINGVKEYNKELLANRLARKHLAGYHVFAQDEGCASVAINKDEDVLMFYFDDKCIEIVNNVAGLDEFITMSCKGELDHKEKTTFLN